MSKLLEILFDFSWKICYWTKMDTLKLLILVCAKKIFLMVTGPERFVVHLNILRRRHVNFDFNIFLWLFFSQFLLRFIFLGVRR